MAGVALQWCRGSITRGSGEAGVISVGHPDFYYVEAHQVNEASDTEN